MICYDGCMTPTEVPQASLSNVAFIARNAIKYGAFLLAFFIIGRVILNMSFSLYRLLNPPKPPEPTYGFGTLPSLTFPQSPFQIKTYTLQTKDGSLPMLANQLPVYFIPVGRASLFSSDNAKQVAGDLGFEFPPEQVSETVYRWKRTTPLTSTLEMDIVSQNFTMRTDWSTDPNFLTNNRKLPTQSEVANRAPANAIDRTRRRALPPCPVRCGRAASSTTRRPASTTCSRSSSASPGSAARLSPTRAPPTASRTTR